MSFWGITAFLDINICPICSDSKNVVKNGFWKTDIPIINDEYKKEIPKMFKDNLIFMDDKIARVKIQRYKCKHCNKTFSSGNSTVFLDDVRNELLAFILKTKSFNHAFIKEFLGVYDSKVIEVEKKLYNEVQTLPYLKNTKKQSTFEELNKQIENSKGDKHKKGIYIEFTDNTISDIMAVNFEES